jgi:hypothetical protein
MDRFNYKYGRPSSFLFASSLLQTGFSTFPILPTQEPAVASGVLFMYTDAVIPSNEAARITAISEDIEFAVVAGCADVIWAYDTTNTFRRDPGTSFDSCWSHVLTSPAVFGFPRQRKSGWLQSLRLASPYDWIEEATFWARVDLVRLDIL